MTATATITSQTYRDVLAVPNAALRFVPPTVERSSKAPVRERHVWILDGDKPVAVTVKTGASDGTLTELVKGKLEPDSLVLVDVVTESKP